MRKIVPFLTAVLLFLLLPAAAQAATAAEIKGDRLVVRNDGGLANNLAVSFAPGTEQPWHLRDRGTGINPGAGCSGDAAVGRLIRCDAALHLRLWLGAGNDRLSFGQMKLDEGGFDIERTIVAYGQFGDDRLEGSSEGDALFGGPGLDLLDGRRGSDHLEGGDGSDIIRGGKRDDSLYGGAGYDHLAGGPDSDELHGNKGADVLLGGAGDDLFLSGGAGADRIYGGAGKDLLTGDRGSDRLNGGPGHDRLLAGPGADVLIGGPGRDYIVGGPGTQVIRTRDGQRDEIICGEGRDAVYADRLDVIKGDCERVAVR